MASRLTVIFYILLCLEAGIFLTLLPWWQPWGLGDWGDNFFLVMVAQKTGLYGLQRAVASGWVRGAVTGIGMLNLAMAFWEMFHFSETVRRLQGADAAPESRGSASNAFAPHAAESLPTTNDPDAASTPTADNVPHHERRDD
ncbi:MAG: hypothetical protein QOJ70_2812 [Acidobacteriota bacterium]|jgi:hypothetical protein|nr:hypothetical protein [Acidobacteriota bacterium]MDT7808999.1 hypothetical protein [Acidobacteriota bacterium]